jgi:hypothetical protein
LSLVRFIPAWLHAIADYAVALSLIVVALVAGGPGKAVAAGVVIGAVVLVVSMLTRYPLGIIKVLPFKVHSAGDYLAAALLVASPFALGFSHSARGLTIFYIGAGAAVLLVSLVTNYQYSPNRQVAARPADQGRSRRLATTQTDDRSDADRWFNAAAQAKQPAYAPQTASPVWEDYESPAQPAPTYERPADPTPASRSLREILAERAATGQTAA